MIQYTDSLEKITALQLQGGFFEGWPTPPSAESHLRILQQSSFVVLAVAESGDVVGFITAISDGVSCAYIPHLEVLPAYRHQGIGSQLIRRMIAELKSFYMVDLICDADLKPFYEKVGMIALTGMALRNYDHQNCAEPNSASPIILRPYSAQYASDCAALLDALPDWFGIPEANAEYLAGLAQLPSWVAIREGKAVAAISLQQHFPTAFEITFMAVHPDYHRQGFGSALVKHVESEARRLGGHWLHVKTLSPSHPDPFYARTREFYAALGFAPLFTSDAFWGSANPAVILVKTL
jgi:N-acetylglutamate synthase and related acetyltransferases